MQGYYKSNVSDVHTCQPCSQIETGCLTCNDSNYCQSCDTFLFLETDNGNCKCKEGYFGSPGSCAPCMLGCLSCTSTVDCSNCHTFGNWEWDSILSECKCKEGYYQDGGTCKLCLIALSGCTKCIDSFNCDSNGCNGALGF